MARLFPAQVIAVAAHCLDDIAVTHGSAFQTQATRGQEFLKPEVRHDGRNQRAAFQPPLFGPTSRHQRHDLIAVRHTAILIKDHHPIRIAIKADADMGAMGHDRLGGGLGMGRSATVVDIGAIGRNTHRDHLGAQFPQHLRRGAIGGAIGAIDHHLQPVQPQSRREGRLDEFLIAAASILNPLGAANVLGLGRQDLAFQNGLDLGLGLIRQFEPVGAKELDAIVMMRIVARRDHHPQIGAHRPGEKAHRRRRHRPQQQHIHPGRGQTRRQRIFQHIARKPRILADDNPMRRTAVAAEEPPCRGPKAQRHFRGHRIGIGAPAHAIGAKKLAAHAKSPTVTDRQSASA